MNHFSYIILCEGALGAMLSRPPNADDGNRSGRGSTGIPSAQKVALFALSKPQKSARRRSLNIIALHVHKVEVCAHLFLWKVSLDMVLAVRRSHRRMVESCEPVITYK